MADIQDEINPSDVVRAIAPAFGTASDLVTFSSGVKGKDGWTYGGLIMLADLVLGRIDYGGESQREWVRVNLTGGGCEWVQDWSKFVDAGMALLESSIKRIDIALTTFEGQVTDHMVVRRTLKVGFPIAAILRLCGRSQAQTLGRASLGTSGNVRITSSCGATKRALK